MRLQLLGLLLLLLLQAVPGLAEPISLNIAHRPAAGSPEALAIDYLKRLLEERSAGRIQATIIREGRGEQQMLAALKTNELQLALLETGTLTEQLPDLQLYDLPFLFRDRNHLQQVSEGEVGRRIAAPAEEIGLQLLAIWDGPAQQLLADRALNEPADRPRQLLSGPTADADWQESTLTAAGRTARQSQQTVLTLTRHRFPLQALLAARDVWQKLPDDLRIIAAGAINDATRYYRELVVQAERAALKELAADPDIEIVTLSTENRRHWQDAMQPLFKESTSREIRFFIAIITGRQTN